MVDEYESTPVQSFVDAQIYGFNGAQSSKRITKSKIESNQRFLNPGWFSPREDTFFGVEGGPWDVAGSGRADNLNMLVLQVWGPQETMMYSREIYNVLDFLGDIGGLFDALKIIGASIIGIFGSGGLKLGLIGRLFFKKPTT